MWGFLGVILSLFDDVWSKNTPDNIEATKMYYDRKKELSQMDEWERRMFILVDKQLKEGFTGMNMYRQYFIEWIPHKVVFINRFELEISEAFCKSELRPEVFIADYMEGRIKEFLIKLNTVFCIFFKLYDSYGNSILCCVREPYENKDIENYYNAEVTIGGVSFVNIPRLNKRSLTTVDKLQQK